MRKGVGRSIGSNWSIGTLPVVMGWRFGAAGNIADIDCSDLVDITDLMLLTQKWLDMNKPLREDFNGDGMVNLKDFAILESYWGWSQ